MKKILLFLLLAGIARAVTFTWDASSSPDVTGYKIHWGITQGAPDNHRDVGNVLTATIDNAILPRSVVDYFTTTAYNAAGVESGPSNEVAFLLEPVAAPSPTPFPNAFRMEVRNGGIHLLPGTVVKISADDPPPGMLFDVWTGDIAILSNPLITPTTATMPAMDVQVAANFKAVPTPTPMPNPIVSIFPAVTPFSFAGSDSSVELGVRFRSDVAGSILGIRFYKNASNTGLHTGRLWTADGVQLASLAFVDGETGNGWLEARFSVPVPIAAGTEYVASYHCNGGFYGYDSGYFSNAGAEPGPLHGINSVYRYGTTSLFPNLNWQAANYWVDVLFQAQ